MSGLTLTNTLTRKKEAFTPLDKDNVRMYVCGITPYDHAHIGHARVYVVFDVLYRLLRYLYGENHVTYVRNFTDIDDKIIARAAEKGEEPAALAERFIASFHEDMAALNCLPLQPGHEPKVSDASVMAGIIAFIGQLMEKGAAYTLDDGVYLDIARLHADDGYVYGQLSGKKIDELVAGARVDAKDGKRNPGDFALWKLAKPGEPKWDSPWGAGRPGWHIECSVMSEQLLGDRFDIHGGGEDLQFPHHENELAQSVACHGHIHANTWVHNAFITVGGKKMSKSLGNFTTIKDLLRNRNKDGAPVLGGNAIRLWLLQTHYRKPVDYSPDALEAAQRRATSYEFEALTADIVEEENIPAAFIEALLDDLNTAKALSIVDTTKSLRQRQAMLELLGMKVAPAAKEENPEVDALVDQRNQARAAKDWAESDRIRDELKAQGIVLEDHPDGTTTWRRG